MYVVIEIEEFSSALNSILVFMIVIACLSFGAVRIVF